MLCPSLSPASSNSALSNTDLFPSSKPFMPVVPADQVKNEEVKTWQGVHLLYFDGSLCVRKVQLVLALKGIAYTKHRVSMQDLHTEWYLGINPRGLVPVLVHDGVVIIESNDILEHLEEAFPTAEPRLTPADLGEAQSVAEYLRTQDDYHMHIRTLTFKCMMPEPVMVQMAMGKVSQMDKEDAEMAIVDVESAGGQGRADQRAFYEAVVANRGIPDAQVATSVARFREVLAGFDIDYKDREFLVGGNLTMADVAIWVDFERLLKVAPDGFAPADEFVSLAAAFRRLALQGAL